MSDVNNHDHRPNGDDITPPERPMVFPGHFVSPTNAPLYIEATAQADDKGGKWVMIRAETLNGSWSCFLTPDSAMSFIEDLGNATRLALTDDTGKLVIPDMAEGIEP